MLQKLWHPLSVPFVSLAILAPSICTATGGAVTGGGDPRAARFAWIGQNALSAVNAICDKLTRAQLKRPDIASVCGNSDTISTALERSTIKPIYWGGPSPSLDQSGSYTGNVIAFGFLFWEAKLLSFNQEDVEHSRWELIHMLLHQAGMKAQLERANSYGISTDIVRLLKENKTDVHALVGYPLNQPFTRTTSIWFTRSTCEDAISAFSWKMRADLGFDPTNPAECKVDACIDQGPTDGDVDRFLVRGQCSRTVVHQKAK